MVRLPQQRFSATADVSWLSMLIESFEQAGPADFHPVPCDPRALALLMAQLARPVSPRAGRGQNVRLLH
jgi:hypothetical protein